MIYLDNNATTALDPAVLDAMMPYLTEEYGNPSSTHKHGARAAFAVESAREKLAASLSTDSHAVYFTSGATESNNTVLKGAYFTALKRGNSAPHFIVSEIEHKCVLNTASFLEDMGADVTYLKVDAKGIINPDDLANAIRPSTVLASVMWVNNEIGAINDIAALASVCHDKGVLFHTDAAQAMGKLSVDVSTIGADFISGSAHKFYGPKGIGFLVASPSAISHITPLLHGGGQESGVRSGTLNVAGIVGLGAAAELFCHDAFVQTEASRQSLLASQLFEGLRKIFPDTTLNGPELGVHRIANNLNVSFPSLNEKMFNKKLKGLMVSSSSACSSADLKASYVLRAIGLDEAIALKSYRFGIGKDTTDRDIVDALTIIQQTRDIIEA